MNNNKNYRVISIAILLSVGIKLTLEFVGIGNIPVQLMNIIMGILIIATIVGVYLNKDKGLGIKFNVILGILTIIAFLLMGIILTIDKCFSSINYKYGNTLTSILMIYYYLYAAYGLFYAIIYKKKKNNIRKQQ